MPRRGHHRRRRHPGRVRLSSQTYKGRIFLNPDPTSNQVYISIGLSSKGNMQFPQYQPNILGDAISESDYNALSEDLVTYINENGIDGNFAGICCMLCCTCGWGALRLYNKSSELEKIIKSKILAANWKIAALPTLVNVSMMSQVPAYDSMGMMCLSGSGTPIWPPIGFSIVLEFLPNHQIRQKWPQSLSMLLAMQALTSLGGNFISQPFLQYQQMQMNMIQQQNPRLSAKFQSHQTTSIAEGIPVVNAQPLPDMNGTNKFDDVNNDGDDEDHEDMAPSMSDQIHSLSDLRAQGIITEEQFEAGKKKLLENYGVTS